LCLRVSSSAVAAAVAVAACSVLLLLVWLFACCYQSQAYAMVQMNGSDIVVHEQQIQPLRSEVCCMSGSAAAAAPKPAAAVATHTCLKHLCSV
jgi:hypothetical protein